MKNKNLKFSLLDYYVEKHHIAPENVEDKVRDLGELAFFPTSLVFVLRKTETTIVLVKNIVKSFVLFGVSYLIASTALFISNPLMPINIRFRLLQKSGNL